MKLRYPAGAFALGIILFSAGMKEAFAAGILVILTAVFAEFLKDLLENAVPAWSLTLCVLIASGVFCASACQISFAYLGLPLSVGTWLMSLIVGLLCARHTLSGNVENEYGELFFESAVAWGFWILLAIIREFMGRGMIFGNPVFQNPVQSKIFLESTFAFLTAGLVLAFTNGFLKKIAAVSTACWLSYRPLFSFARSRSQVLPVSQNIWELPGRSSYRSCSFFL
uniref:hypothetical protein n=1 Tax=Mediterraneibacter glycyrrhizinilyticus TaxID=342942 RepID=UPI000AD092A9